jgi:hypothetical protein
MKGAYVVLKHIYMPIAEGENRGKTQVHEECEFLDVIRPKHTNYATVIMDVMNRKFIKNRARSAGATYEDLEAHIIRGYKDKYKQFLTAVGAELPVELQEVEVTDDTVVPTEE